MQRFELRIERADVAKSFTLDVPDLTTALVVADINIGAGSARISDGEKLVATIEKRGVNQAAYWVIGQAG